MWKANIQSVAADETASVAKVEIKYSNDDGREKIVMNRISEPESIKKIALDGLRELERIDAVKALVENPKLGLLDFTVPEPTQEEVDRQIYEEKRMGLIRLKQDLELGLIDQKVYDEALMEIKK